MDRFIVSAASLPCSRNESLSGRGHMEMSEIVQHTALRSDWMPWWVKGHGRFRPPSMKEGQRMRRVMWNTQAVGQRVWTAPGCDEGGPAVDPSKLLHSLAAVKLLKAGVRPISFHKDPDRLGEVSA